MSNWMHLELNFKEVDFSKEAFPQKKPEGSYRELISYLNEVINSVSDFIKRYFFLFEPNPHLFMAIELKNANDFESVKKKIEKIKKRDFFASCEIKFPTDDDDHPEGVLDFFHASAKYAFFRISDQYKPGYKNHDETKIIHCFCNQLFVNHDNERFFHLKCSKNSGLLFDYVYNCLRNSGFPKAIPEFLFWDFCVNNFSYKNQRVFIVRHSDKGCFFSVEHFHKVNDNIVKGLSHPDRLFSTEQEAEDKAKEMIDKKLYSGAWIEKQDT